MKRTLFLIVLAMIVIGTLFAEQISLGSESNSLQVLQSSAQETILQYKIQHFDTKEVRIQGQSWYHINLPKEGTTQDKGLPQLPVFNRSITIDGMAKMKLEIFDIEYTDLKLAVAPSKGVITRNIDPATVPYEFDSIYQGNSFYPEKIATLSEPYILRDFRGITVKTTPFAYRPSTGTLRVYTSYKVRVYQDGNDTLNTMPHSRDSISRAFAPLYENHFVNWQNQRYVPVDDSYGKLLVICHTSFMTAIQPWVNWKKQKGIETELVQWSTIGTTAAQLQTYIQTRYNQDNSLSYVQIVGDGPQIPTLSYTTSGMGTGGSDPSFSLVAGSDNYPDIFIGRFSAETVPQLEVQLNRSIAYERDTTTSDTWLSKAMGIASAEGGYQGDNGETDIQHMNVIRTKLLNYGYSTVDQVHDPGASASTVTTNINAGRGFLNYIGHGNNTVWSTTNFSTTNAMNLTNGNKAPFIVDVACLNGNFVSTTCFAEGWMRSPNGGAITIYASTINQSWASPMRGQDEITDLWVAESKNTAGGFYYNGSCKMMDIYGNTSGSDGVNMFKTWHIFGDASLMARSKTPVAMAVTHPNQIIIGTSSMTVNTGVANALVALSYNNQIYGRGFTNGGGTLTLPLSGMPTGSLDYTLTVTAHNRVTYVGTVQQIPYPTEPRFVAEWEPAQGAVIRYPFGQPFSLLRDLSNEALLYVIVSSSNQSTATSNLQSNSVNMANVRYVIAATDSYWTRDYAPWTIFDAEHNMHLVDFNYNRPRPNDNLIPSVLAGHLNTNLYDLNMNHTGGNMMTDGMGKAMSTTLVLSENSSLTGAQINQRFRDILGVTEYFMYADPLSNSSIDHIDCHAKLLDVDKVMIARVPAGHSNYTALEATVATWQSKTSSYGTPYQIFRVNQSSANEPYANAFIFNKKIYVPQWNSTTSSYDTAAIAAYQAAMPGYIVQGYYDGTFISDDAVHCRVNTIFDNQMIAVRHQPISDLTAYQEYTLTVEIDHVNTLNAESSFIAWSTSSSGPWQHSNLSHDGANNYSTSIIAGAHLQNLYYWIQASDITGRITTLPLCAGLDPFVAEVSIPSPTLDKPVVSINNTGFQLLLNWPAVPNADSYRILAANNPDGTFSLFAESTANSLEIDTDEARRFFKVIAVKDEARIILK